MPQIPISNNEDENRIMTLPSEFSSSSPDHTLQQCSTCAVSKKTVCINKGEHKNKQHIGVIISFIIWNHFNKMVHLKWILY